MLRFTRSVYASVLKLPVLFALLCCFFGGDLYSQEQDGDTVNIYVRLKHFAYKRKITRMAFDAVFVDPEPNGEHPQPLPPEQQKKKNINPYLRYEGRIIRRIDVIVLKPFGSSVYDTSAKALNTLQKTANRFHFRTRRFVILNRLLFEEAERLNALAVSESERILRQEAYVNDARIEVKKTGSRDSVDVVVYVHDRWPITVPVILNSANSGSIRFRNKNMFGVGQNFEQYGSYSHPGTFNFNGSYEIPNIDETYISSRFYYEAGANGTQLLVSFDRPFYSPLSRWAGGVTTGKSWRQFEYWDEVSSTSKRVPLGFTYVDLWGAKSSKLSTDASIFNQSTNIITGLRYYGTTYQRRPSFSIDTAKLFRNNWSVVGNAGLAVQQYYKEKFIFRFGATEDVPEGLLMQLLYGVSGNEFQKQRYYLGGEIASARHFKPGYFTASFAYGVFFNTGVANDVTSRFRLYYFSNIIKKDKWYFRQFANYELVTGVNKNHWEKVTISSNELYGFNPGAVNGNTKMTLNLETVAYAPYKVIGFKFAPVLMIGFGMLGDPVNKLHYNPVYQAYVLGILIRNENLLTSTFQISAGFYPFLPDGRRNVFLYSPVTSFTLRVRGFSVDKPGFVGY